ncbi:hypothetical protein NC652_013998 [Populus alba x Populus x berolinensis]|nr:hypothetical protein NC652_013998 [Populus alba x Populus x berolinensis]
MKQSGRRKMAYLICWRSGEVDVRRCHLLLWFFFFCLLSSLFSFFFPFEIVFRKKNFWSLLSNSPDLDEDYEGKAGAAGAFSGSRPCFLLVFWVFVLWLLSLHFSSRFWVDFSVPKILPSSLLCPAFYKAEELQKPSPPRTGSWQKTWSRFGSDAL